MAPKFWKKRKNKDLLWLDLEVVTISKILSWQTTPVIAIGAPWDVAKEEEAAIKQLQRSPSILCRQVSEVLLELAAPSNITSEDELTELSRFMPRRFRSAIWVQVYSSADHGFSLNTLYRLVADIDSQLLLLIKDNNNRVFGAFLSSVPKICQNFYGTGETFLFSFHKEFKKYAWTGKNDFFINGNVDSLAIGSGNGSFGLWLDSELHRGRSQHCQTFDNDVLTDTEDFTIKDIEAWAFH